MNTSSEAASVTDSSFRYRMLEFDFARSADPDEQSAVQQAIDRARAQSHKLLRRSLAELRKLRTERQKRIRLSPDKEVPVDLGTTDSKRAGLTAGKAQSSPAADTNRAAIAAAIDENRAAIAAATNERRAAIVAVNRLMLPPQPKENRPARKHRPGLCLCGSPSLPNIAAENARRIDRASY